MQPNLMTAKFRVNCETRTPIVFSSFPGTTLRGAFGYAFKDSFCVSDQKECAHCSLREQCVYAYVFETPILPNQTKVSAEKAPHPFVIKVNEIPKRSFKPGESWSFDLTLIGRAISLLPFFTQTFAKMGIKGLGKSKGKFSVSRIINLDTGDEIDLFRMDFSKLNRIETVEDRDASNLELEIKSPLRLMTKGSLVRDIDFQQLIRHCLRRISNLQYFHGTEELRVDFVSLINRCKEVPTLESNLTWVDHDRFSTRQGKLVPLGGLVGTVVFGPGWKEFYPYLKLLERVHLGKNCTFGLGHVEFKVY